MKAINIYCVYWINIIDEKQHYHRTTNVFLSCFGKHTKINITNNKNNNKNDRMIYFPFSFTYLLIKCWWFSLWFLSFLNRLCSLSNKKKNETSRKEKKIIMTQKKRLIHPFHTTFSANHTVPNKRTLFHSFFYSLLRYIERFFLLNCEHLILFRVFRITRARLFASHDAGYFIPLINFLFKYSTRAVNSLNGIIYLLLNWKCIFYW